MTQWLRGMTAGAVGCCRAQVCQDGDKPISIPIVIPAQAGIQEGGGAVVNGWPILADGALGGHPFKLSFPLCGNVLLNHWIPAFAGMTEGAAVRHLSGMAKGLSGCQPVYSLLGVIPAQAGIQETEARW